jgi:DNA-binding NarL/FixJ family response regulator
MIRVLICADDPLARAGLATLLVDHPGLTIVGRIGLGGNFLAEVDLYRPDVIIIDLGWEPHLAIAEPRVGLNHVRTPLDSLAELREFDLPVVALLPDGTYLTEAWTAGAQALLLRHTDTPKLIAAIRAMMQKLVVFEGKLTAAGLPSKSLESTTLVEPLTPRELEVLHLVAEGLPNKAIARRLEVSDHTVKFHVNAILTKLGVQSRTEAVVRATRLGLILL